MNAAGLLLAAGASSRMGRPKALLPFGGETVMERGVRNFHAAGIERVVVVLGCWETEIRRACPDLFNGKVEAALNPEPDLGMLSSVQCGLRAAANLGVDVLLLALLDQPFVPPLVYRQTLESCTARSVAIPQYNGRRGHPIALSMRLAEEILAMNPERQTLRDFVRAEPGRIQRVPVETDAILRDMDAPAEYHNELRRLQQKHGERDAP